MKTSCSVVLTLVLAFLAVPCAYAVDEGQSQPKLSRKVLASSSSSLSGDLIPLTSGSGNVKGVICSSGTYSVVANAQIHFYVDGGPARTLSLTDYPFLVDNFIYNTGMMPMNVRFETSIRIVIQRSATSDGLTCAATWGLD